MKVFYKGIDLAHFSFLLYSAHFGELMTCTLALPSLVSSLSPS